MDIEIFVDKKTGLGLPIRLIRILGIRSGLQLCYYHLKGWFIQQVFCRAGFHRFHGSGEQHVLNSKGLDLQTVYVECPYCGLMMFPSKYYKEMYLRMKARQAAMWKNIVENLGEKSK
jgi:hypothetical protein